MLTVAEGCILVAVVLAYGVLGLAKRHKGYDNAYPRDPGFFKSGFRARVYGAHSNGLEALPFFIGAIILAEIHGANQVYLNGMAVGFIALRVAYTWAYIADKPGLRSAIWGVGFLVNIGIFCLPLVG
jgi:uncharacterized MAPEG superfamily protein